MRKDNWDNYFHSVHLDEEKCKGCTHCIRTCPTEAIRVRNGKATIMVDRCIDCGECIRTCPNNAKSAITDPLEIIESYRYKIAIPAPSFLGQFSRRYPAEKVLSGFLYMGFDDVLEVGFGAAMLARAITAYLRKEGATLPRPVISSACPAVVRLIQVKYPGLIGNLLVMQSPMEVTARFVKEQAARDLKMDESDIGVFFISPCPAKVTVVKQPIGCDRSWVDGVIAAKDMVNYIKLNFEKISERNNIRRAPKGGINWGRSGGEAESVDVPYKLSVDGIHHVSRVLEKIEEGIFRNIHFIEAQACVGGCVGGVLMVENPFVSKLKVEIVARETDEKYQHVVDDAVIDSEAESFMLSEDIKPRPIIPLSSDVGAAMKKLKEIDALCEDLPGIDCGACGCPTCRAFAEDVAAGLMSRIDCLLDLRLRVKNLAQEIFALAKKLPNVMQDEGEGQ